MDPTEPDKQPQKTRKTKDKEIQKKKHIPPDERPDEAKRRERPDGIPPANGNPDGYTDLEREREAELPPDKRKEP